MQKIASPDSLRNFVRSAHYNLYLLHFFAPRACRQDLVTLMALHTELRQIPQRATDPMMRLIRLTWWQDEIKKIQNGTAHADSPILEAMTHLCPMPDFSAYFSRFDQSLRGEDADIDEVFYNMMTSVIPQPKAKERFIKKLMLHDQMDEDVPFRALRLWLGC